MTIQPSVHLSNFPISQVEVIDIQLEETMDIAENLCSLVFSLRKKEKLKVRQPLQKMMVPVLSAKFASELKHIESLIRNEVNVKEIVQIEASNNLIVKKAKPNFKTLGPKLGEEMKSIAAIVNGFDQNQIRELEVNGHLDINLNSRQFKLDFEDVEIVTMDMPGWLVASNKGVTVALDITLTPELVMEGHARELVNRVQTMRKETGFELTDRISVSILSDKELQDSFTAHKTYICSEILAEEILFVSDSIAEEIDLNGHTVKIAIKKIN